MVEPPQTDAGKIRFALLIRMRGPAKVVSIRKKFTAAVRTFPVLACQLIGEIQLKKWFILTANFKCFKAKVEVKTASRNVVTLFLVEFSKQ